LPATQLKREACDAMNGVTVYWRAGLAGLRSVGVAERSACREFEGLRMMITPIPSANR
jgi:hypothetical protein